jgi:hypothetical protein
MAMIGVPASVVAAIQKLWPEGVIEEFDRDESYFHSMRESLERDLRSIDGASLLWQTEEGENAAACDDEPAPEDEPWCSYHVFFLSPKGSEFHFDDATERIDFDEDTGDELPPEACAGEGWIGCSVGVSLAARFAAIALDSYSQFEDGSRHSPDIESCMYSVETGQPIDTDQYYRQTLGEGAAKTLHQLRDQIAAVLKKHRIQVLATASLDLPVADLAADEEVYVEPPVRVRDAFFFRGV